MIAPWPACTGTPTGQLQSPPLLVTFLVFAFIFPVRTVYSGTNTDSPLFSPSFSSSSSNTPQSPLLFFLCTFNAVRSCFFPSFHCFEHTWSVPVLLYLCPASFRLSRDCSVRRGPSPPLHLANGPWFPLHLFHPKVPIFPFYSFFLPPLAH